MGRKHGPTSYSEMLVRIYNRYLAEGGTKPVRLDDLYEFAERNNMWAVPKTDIRKRFCKDMSRALREDYFMDDAGRPVRRHHAIRVKEEDPEGKPVQKSLWDDIDTAPREHMEGAFQLRRRQIVGDCKQLKNDADYFNDVRTEEEPIRVLFDFTDDLSELEQPTKYMPDRGGDD